MPAHGLPGHDQPAPAPASAAASPAAARAAELTSLTVFILALLSVVAPLATDMYLPSFPEISDDLTVSTTAVQFTLTTFMIGMGVGQLVFGPLSDRFGRRPLLVVGTALCLVASVLGALAPSIGVLVVMRLLQGLGGSAGAVIARAVVTDLAQGVRAAQVFGVLMMIGGVAPVFAPLLGSVLASTTGWRGCFWVLAVASAAMLVGSLALRESLPAGRRTRGGIGESARLTLRILSDRFYVGYTLSFMLSFGLLFAYISASSFVLQDIYGLSTGLYSATFAVNSVAMVAMNGVNSKLVTRHHPRRLLLVGVTVQLVATAVFTVLAVADALPLVALLVILLVAAASMGLVLANGTSLAVSTVPYASGTASAFMGALQSVAAAAVSPLVSIGGGTSVVPTAVTMLVCAAGSLALLSLARGRHPLDEHPAAGGPVAAH